MSVHDRVARDGDQTARPPARRPPGAGGLPPLLRAGNAAAARAVLARVNGKGEKRPRREGAKYAVTDRRTKRQKAAAGESAESEPAAPEAPPLLPDTGAARRVFWFGYRSQMHWRDYPKLVQSLAKKKKDEGGRTLYQCESTKAFLPRKADAVGDETHIEIDHRQNWNDWVTLHASAEDVEFGGHTYHGVPIAKALDEYNNPENLRLWSSTLNAQKSGPKDIDAYDPPVHSPDCSACKPPPKKGPGGHEDSDDEGGGGDLGFGGGDPIPVSAH